MNWASPARLPPRALSDPPGRAAPRLPGQHEVGAGVVGPRPGGTPLDGVDLFAVGLQVVDTRVLLHTPDLYSAHTHTHTHTHKHTVVENERLLLCMEY